MSQTAVPMWVEAVEVGASFPCCSQPLLAWVLRQPLDYSLFVVGYAALRLEQLCA